MRDRIVTASAVNSEEESIQLSLRPKRLRDYIGQKELRDKLKVTLDAARRRKEAAEHILFYGPPGLGKTTLAHIIANEMKAKAYATAGPALKRSGDLMGILTNLKDGDILFIDEIHRLSPVIEEFLYPAMEDFKVDFVVDKGAFAKVINVPLKHFTLVGATTRAGMLSAPLRDRFGIYYHIDFYPPEDLEQIIVRSAGLLRSEIEPEAARSIALRSRGTPRIANRLLKRIRDYAQIKADGVINREVANEALKSLEVDDKGFDKMDRKLLLTIIHKFKGGPVGVETLSASINEEKDTIEEVYEPYLIQEGYLNRTPRGRVATELAYNHFNIKPTGLQSSQN